MGECNFADQLLSAPLLNYTITHKDVTSNCIIYNVDYTITRKGVISSISQCDWTDWLLYYC